MRLHPLACLALLAVLTGCAPAPLRAAKTSAAARPIEREVPIEVALTNEPSPYFIKDGKPFCFVGTNNYYLMYESREAVREVLDVALRMNLEVLRIWAFLDRGSLDGSVPNVREPGHKEGVYFQYWDPALGRPAYNDGPDGLEHLDWVLHEARERGLLLTLVLTNNWRDFGGMDQYLVWYGLERHHEFYTDERVRSAYEAWVEHLVTRINSVDGIRYSDDPTIFAWELANEPRTFNYESYDSDEGWDVDTITRWAERTSAFIKSLDPHHMVAVGDEGFLKEGRNHWTYEAPGGVDSEALTRLPHVDFGTYHLYPDHWAVSHHFGEQWILDHIALSRLVDKPVLLEEYGIHVRRQADTAGPVVSDWPRRRMAYLNWNNLVLHSGGAASLFWMLSAHESPGRLYPDYDHFAVYEGDQTYELLRSYAERAPTEARACALAAGASDGSPSRFVKSASAVSRRSVR